MISEKSDHKKGQEIQKESHLELVDNFLCSLDKLIEINVIVILVLLVLNVITQLQQFRFHDNKGWNILQFLKIGQS